MSLRIGARLGHFAQSRPVRWALGIGILGGGIYTILAEIFRRETLNVERGRHLKKKEPSPNKALPTKILENYGYGGANKTC